jgi:hypothetical protein
LHFSVPSVLKRVNFPLRRLTFRLQLLLRLPYNRYFSSQMGATWYTFS